MPPSLLPARFTFSHGEDVLARFSLDPGSYVIGRDESCQVVIELEGMQPRHARLVVSPSQVRVEDLGSGAATLLAGAVVEQSACLPPNQPVRFGECIGVLTLEPRLEEQASSRAGGETGAKSLAVENSETEPSRDNAPVPNRMEESALADEVPRTEMALSAASEERRGDEEAKAELLKEETAGATEGEAVLPDAPTQTETAVEVEQRRVPSDGRQEDKADAAGAGAAVMPAERPFLVAIEGRPVEDTWVGAESNAWESALKAEQSPKLLSQQAAELTTNHPSKPNGAERAPMEAKPSAALFSEVAATPAAPAARVLPPEAEAPVVPVTRTPETPRRRRKPRLTFPKERGMAANQTAYPEGSPGWAVWPMEKAAAANETSSAGVAGELAASPAPVNELRLRLEAREEELAALRDELAKAKADVTAALAEVERRAASEQEKAKEKAGLLSIANKALLKKLSKASEPAQEQATLRKELQQREAALVEAWARRQAADERCSQLARQVAYLESGRSEPAPAAAVHVPAWLAWSFLGAIAAALTLGFLWNRSAQQAERAEKVVAALRSTAPQFYSEAKAYLSEGNFQPALAKVESAISLDAKQADYLLLKANLCESLLMIEPAITSYEAVMQREPGNAMALKNLELCRSIKASRKGAHSPESMYALHGLMMDQGRLPEALQMARRLGDDLPLQHRTWSAIFEGAGLKAQLVLNEEKSFDLDLSSQSHVDLAMLRGLPLRKLSLAKSNVSDLTPLHGSRIRELDLSGNPVHDLAPLSGMPLEVLNLANTEVSNLFPLGGMESLRELVLDFAPVSDLSALRGLRLQTLRATGTSVWSLLGLGESPLKRLELARTRVSDLGPLEHLPLEVLDLAGTAVASVQPLEGAPLRELNLAKTAVRSVAPLAKAPLRRLELGGCAQLEGVAALAGCLELERLTLPVQVKDVRALKGLPQLRFLAYDAEGNGGDKIGAKTAQEFWATAGK